MEHLKHPAADWRQPRALGLAEGFGVSNGLVRRLGAPWSMGVSALIREPMLKRRGMNHRVTFWFER